MQTRPGDDPSPSRPSARREPAVCPALDRVERRLLIHLLIRIGIYTALMAVLLVTLPSTFHVRHDGSITEDTVLERLQLVLLALTVLICLASAWRRASVRGPMIALAGAAAIAIVRELDFWFDELIPWGGWATAAVVVGTLFGACAWHWRASFASGVPRLLRSAGFPMMWCGALTVILVAQLIGHGPTMEEILGDAFRRLGKRFIEEALEMVGYMLLFFGAIELAVTVWSGSRPEGAQECSHG